ncbi:hypothetical protein ES332_A01G194600v1 [Gossypium tomentosum]|uniref:TF-B3 domain-containing protein n=1 Tax=Gossypium tomentosum TaxID=34277 RepID=A0A5D2RSJ6_GOSTO|nr:hypothetical protein ES332_A01G194600v1 [Gossypium tomentosum]
MMKLLCLDDFKHKKINPNWSPFDILLQVTEVDQLKLQKSRHNDHLKHFLYDAPPRNMCSKLRFKFNNGVELKRKHLPPKFKQHILEEMGGTGLVLSFLHTLLQVKTHDFLNKAEAKELAHKNPMQVCLLDPSLQQTSITFNKWVMGNTSLYVLTNTWNCVVKNNQLEKGVMVQLWSFRMNSLLCFALLKLYDFQSYNIRRLLVI